VTRRDQAEIALACALLPPALEILAASRVLAWLRRVPPRRDRSPAPEILASTVDRLLHRAPAYWHYSCLRRSVVLAALLRRAGHNVEVVFGVRRAPAGGVEAHAWLRCDGIEPFLEPAPTEGFAPLRSSAGEG
jgi:hypothetical protein